VYYIFLENKSRAYFLRIYNNKNIMHKESKFIYNIILPPMIVYGIHLSLIPVYYVFPNLDIITHTLGGGAIAWGWITIANRYNAKSPKLISFITAVGVVALVATFWEFYEFILDSYIGSHINQPTVQDTMGDYLFGLIGALIISLLRIKKSAR